MVIGCVLRTTGSSQLSQTMQPRLPCWNYSINKSRNSQISGLSVHTVFFGLRLSIRHDIFPNDWYPVRYTFSNPLFDGYRYPASSTKTGYPANMTRTNTGFYLGDGGGGISNKKKNRGVGGKGLARRRGKRIFFGIFFVSLEDLILLNWQFIHVTFLSRYLNSDQIG